MAVPFSNWSALCTLPELCLRGKPHVTEAELQCSFLSVGNPLHSVLACIQLLSANEVRFCFTSTRKMEDVINTGLIFRGHPLTVGPIHTKKCVTIRRLAYRMPQKFVRLLLLMVTWPLSDLRSSTKCLPESYSPMLISPKTFHQGLESLGITAIYGTGTSLVPVFLWPAWPQKGTLPPAALMPSNSPIVIHPGTSNPSTPTPTHSIHESGTFPFGATKPWPPSVKAFSHRGGRHCPKSHQVQSPLAARMQV